jgi:hypothetical protein
MKNGDKRRRRQLKHPARKMQEINPNTPENDLLNRERERERV